MTTQTYSTIFQTFSFHCLLCGRLRRRISNATKVKSINCHFKIFTLSLLSINYYSNSPHIWFIIIFPCFQSTLFPLFIDLWFLFWEIGLYNLLKRDFLSKLNDQSNASQRIRKWENSLYKRGSRGYELLALGKKFVCWVLINKHSSQTLHFVMFYTNSQTAFSISTLTSLLPPPPSSNLFFHFFPQTLPNNTNTNSLTYSSTHANKYIDTHI